MSVRELLEYRAATTPRRAAFIEGSSGRMVTWADIAATSPPPTGLLDLALSDPLEMATAFLAALAAGVPVRPVDPAAPRPAPCSAPLEPETALVMSSSGTTGPPKAILLTERQLLHTATHIVAHHDFGPEDRGYSPLPLFHINGLVVGVLSTLVAGSSLVVDRRFSARSFWDTVGHYGVTWLNAVPAILAILADGESPLPSTWRRVRFARSASAPLPETTRARFERRCGVYVLETYGMTEAASQITASPLDPRRRRSGSVGQPVGIDVRVIDGHVEIRGPSVRGPAGPASWLRTGDLGHLDEDGFLYLSGRADDVINRAGEKFHPREVEEVLLGDSRVRAAVVVARPHPILGEEAVAFVVRARGDGGGDDGRGHGGDAAALVASLVDRCERALSPFKRPAEITVAETLPAGPTGKVRRAELRRLALEAAVPR